MGLQGRRQAELPRCKGGRVRVFSFWRKKNSLRVSSSSSRARLAHSLPPQKIKNIFSTHTALPPKKTLSSRSHSLPPAAHYSSDCTLELRIRDRNMPCASLCNIM